MNIAEQQTADTAAQTTVTIRRAEESDIPRIDVLLGQVLDVHHAGRPDLFRAHARKYDDDQLRAIIADDDRPIFVADVPGLPVAGYAFCVFQRHPDDHILTDITTLYVDDLCVDEAARGTHVGSALYRHVIGFARESGCHNVTLNVWSCNPQAMAFYEHMGLRPYKVGMEALL
ncbi:GNAT family N-acetyltransferase [Bifidobacterium simiarum]|uniref:GNAT family N-acetyltransferase n=1 Tax=Bifidobacterium simiarum TaxID=2045441 RepID=A0A2M9HDV2_9BIFI|nr:GNAT family N-acetyltransferase [Bifidobacterium simiarum]PJM74991.1 GNAT family N-acetyltransferase [Bifidobacterium simiarum]